MTKITIERETLLPCPFCGDDGDKGRQEVTQMIEGRNKFARITCRACGAMCPEENWNRRAALAQKAEPPSMPQGKSLALLDLDSVEHMQGGANGPTIRLRGFINAQTGPTAPQPPIDNAFVADGCEQFSPPAEPAPVPCCGKYETCSHACTPRGKWLGRREAESEIENRRAAQPADAQPTGQSPCARHCEAPAFEGEIRRLKRELQTQAERVRVLEHLVIDAAYTLDKARIWNGMGWTYNPLHPVHYTPMRERLHNECDSIEAARAALEQSK